MLLPLPRGIARAARSDDQKSAVQIRRVDRNRTVRTRRDIIGNGGKAARPVVLVPHHAVVVLGRRQYIGVAVQVGGVYRYRAERGIAQRRAGDFGSGREGTGSVGVFIPHDAVVVVRGRQCVDIAVTIDVGTVDRSCAARTVTE